MNTAITDMHNTLTLRYPSIIGTQDGGFIIKF